MLRMSEEERKVIHDDGKVSYIIEQVFQRPGENPKFVFSDSPLNQGPGVRACTEQRAKELYERFGYEPEEIEFYERREDGLYHKPEFKIVSGEFRKYDTDTYKTYTEDQISAWVTKGILRSPDDNKQEQKQIASVAEKVTQDAWGNLEAKTSVGRNAVQSDEIVQMEEYTEQQSRRR